MFPSASPSDHGPFSARSRGLFSARAQPRRMSISEKDFHDLLTGQRPALDIEWFAVDRSGHIAGFTTAGFAEIPSLVLRDRIALNRANSFIASVPVVGNAIWVRTPPLCGETWTNWG